jgi:hypothetical protein
VLGWADACRYDAVAVSKKSSECRKIFMYTLLPACRNKLILSHYNLFNTRGGLQIHVVPFARHSLIAPSPSGIRRHKVGAAVGPVGSAILLMYHKALQLTGDGTRWTKTLAVAVTVGVRGVCADHRVLL